MCTSATVIDDTIKSITTANPSEHWGVSVSLRTPSSAFRRVTAFNAQQYFVPASNVKLLTTTALFRKLGAQNPSFRTRVVQVNQRELCVLGAGDPSLNSTALSGIPALQGRVSTLSVDERVFVAAAARLADFPASWEAGDLLLPYGASVNALMMQSNAVELQVSMVGAQPAVRFAVPSDADVIPVVTRVTNKSPIALSIENGTVVLSGKLASGAQAQTFRIAMPEPARERVKAFLIRSLRNKDPAFAFRWQSCDSKPWQPWHEMQSAPMLELMHYCLLESDNTFAEALGRFIVTHDGTPLLDMQTAMDEIFRQLPQNVTSHVGRMADMCGLSRHNLVAPQAFETLMQFVATQMPQYLTLLPVGGVSGTLKHRFRNTPLQGNVFAKTGTESGISTLSGVVKLPTGTATFSVLVNNSPRSATLIRKDIDKIVLAIGQFLH